MTLGAAAVARLSNEPRMVLQPADLVVEVALLAVAHLVTRVADPCVGSSGRRVHAAPVLGREVRRRLLGMTRVTELQTEVVTRVARVGTRRERLGTVGLNPIALFVANRRRQHPPAVAALTLGSGDLLGQVGLRVLRRQPARVTPHTVGLEVGRPHLRTRL